MNYYNDHRDDEVLEKPSDEQVEYWVFDSVCEATDGCTIEPDGTCEHGHDSWLIVLGLC